MIKNDFIGINIGSKNTVIGTYQNDVFEVILSDSSKRTISTIVSYEDRFRKIEEINKKNIKRSIIYPNRWLGIEKDSLIYKQEKEYAYSEPTCNNNILSFKIDYKNKIDYYTPQCLMGLFFNKIAKIWHKKGIQTNNVVVSVPDYYLAQERIAMLESIKISGLNCLGLLNESSAICLVYGIQRLKEFDSNNKRNVIFIDFGHSHTSIILCSFTNKIFKIESVLSDRFCGAREFDYLIAEKASHLFSGDLLSSPKAKFSLFEQVNKLRKNLSVNKEASFHIDNINDGKDLDFHLKREDFEKIIEPALKKFENLCENFLEKTKIDLNNIHSIEMVADTLRTPILNNIIKKKFLKDLSKTLVPDEVIAKGCAIWASLKSKNKVNSFNFNQYNPYNIDIVNFTSKNESWNNNIFLEGDKFPLNIEKIIDKKDLENKTNFVLDINYNKGISDLNFLVNMPLISYKILLPPENNNNWNLTCKFVLNENCIPKLEKVLATQDDNNIEGNFEIIKIFGETPTNTLNEYIKREENQEIEDIKTHEAIDYKNSIEEYIYGMRNKINSGVLNGCFLGNEKNELNQKMDELMNWFNENKDDDLYDKNKLEIRVNDMKRLGDIIYSRFNIQDNNNKNKDENSDNKKDSGKNTNNNNNKPNMNKINNKMEKINNQNNVEGKNQSSNYNNKMPMNNQNMNRNNLGNNINNQMNMNNNIPGNFMNNQMPYQQMPQNYQMPMNQIPIYNQINASQKMPMDNFRINNNKISMNPQMNMYPQNFQMYNQFNNQMNMNPMGFQMNQQQMNSGIMGNKNINSYPNMNNILVNLFFVKNNSANGVNILANINESFSSVLNKYINKSGDCNPNKFFYNNRQINESLSVFQNGINTDSLIQVVPFMG